MNSYLNWKEKTITDFSDENINSLYSEGFVFTRKNKGVMNQTRSVRINLDKFELSSENKRILRKTENLELRTENLPYGNYSWEIGKMGKDFYEGKFGKGTFSANKIKELLTSEEKSNFNKLLKFSVLGSQFSGPVGYAVCVETNNILHYSYPFYELRTKNYELNNVGLGMMTRAVNWAKENNKKYIYLGSASSSKSLYKFQFKGIEWFDGEIWTDDVEELKKLFVQ